jgi:hypothetical protein
MIIPPLIALSGVAAALAILYGLRWTVRGAQKRNPLTRDLLRSPGYSLRQQVEAITLDGMADVASLMVVPAMAALLFAAMGSRPQHAATYAGVGLLSLGGVGFFAVRLARRWKRLIALRLALDGEMATGEELNQLMLSGWRVFHDVPADGFNIDHVVVGPAGVLAVETKTRAKAASRDGAETATVRYDGDRLYFPSWQGREALEQAKRQAEWLRKWLTRAVGEPVAVTPVLALPGWFVERKGAGDVVVINPKETRVLVEQRNRKQLTAQSVQRIAHQLEQRCRDVVPLAYREARPDAPRFPSTR